MKKFFYYEVFLVFLCFIFVLFIKLNNSAYASTNTPKVINEGDKLLADSYFTIPNLTVTEKVVSDFPKNSVISSLPGFTPFFSEDNSFNIPSEKGQNAVATFNEPLDPTKDFSISAEITVPNAKIAAAGIYISDIEPDNIVSSLGDTANGSPGSSGSLKNDKSSYDGHYMLFSGFHNSGGYAAIISSGTDYTRITKGASYSGGSRYIDSDWVGFGSFIENVTIRANIEYDSTKKIVTVMYTHDSKSTNNAWNSSYNGYTNKNKTAKVEFSINSSKPIYLGIVGNGNDSSNRELKTSKTRITEITGTYVTQEKKVFYKDDAGNTLAPESKIIIPYGATFGVDNDKAIYNYGKPDMPNGYTYIPEQNNMASKDDNLILTFQRDFQTLRVDYYNKLTGKKLFNEDNKFIGYTNQVLSVKTPVVPGYYYSESMKGDIINSQVESDGSSIQFDIKMDDTPNGTSTIDNEEQTVSTYLIPSVQERILTIYKPDGTVLEEKQTSTTDTPFGGLKGDYVIPGYYVLIDGKRVADEYENQGIPGEPTDKTNNLKSSTDKEPQRHTVTYEAKPQIANIYYRDLTKDLVIKEDSVTGETGALISYDTTSKISEYLKQGYVLKSNSFVDGVEKFDNNPAVVQEYFVDFVRDSEKESETKSISHEVNYSSNDSEISLPENYIQETKISYSYYVDKISHDKIISDFDNYATNGVIENKPKEPVYISSNPKVTVDSSGLIQFDMPIVPDINLYKALVSNKNKIKYSDAGDVEKLISTVIYEENDEINVTVPTDMIFYNIQVDSIIKSPVYNIINNSKKSVKVSLDNFSSREVSTKMKSDFTLNLVSEDKRGNSVNTPLIKNSVIQKDYGDLFILNSYSNPNEALDDHIGTLKFNGNGIISETQKLKYKLSLEFECVE